MRIEIERAVPFSSDWVVSNGAVHFYGADDRAWRAWRGSMVLFSILVVLLAPLLFGPFSLLDKLLVAGLMIVNMTILAWAGRKAHRAKRRVRALSVDAAVGVHPSTEELRASGVPASAAGVRVVVSPVVLRYPGFAGEYRGFAAIAWLADEHFVLAVQHASTDVEDYLRAILPGSLDYDADGQNAVEGTANRVLFSRLRRPHRAR